ncbi:hypothetical protein [Planococcus shenhongbingii]|uniref:C2H2-type domain-containing protein n=1 Tax=Planococcus shenhongbingii TaxID=3058398 RepID=A0ABT8N9T5_9BACL|nr:hypothetical protein [Planococcus sp. N017]MDN7244645.1 hypothetical protein [Planococcus sp. N017]
MYCKKCGTKHPVNINYCQNDAEDLQPILATSVQHRTTGYCGGCGKTLNAVAQYCQHCGESHSAIKTISSAADSLVKPQMNSFSMPNIAGLSFSKNSLAPVLLAVGITILLTIFAAFVLKTQVEDYVIENSYGEITKADFQYMDQFITEELRDESMRNIDFPNIYNLFTYISTIHSIDFVFNGEVSGNDEGEYIQGKFELLSQNTTLSLLGIVLIVLVIGGVALGYLVEKNGLPLGQSIVKFSLMYGLFLMVSSAIANFSFRENIELFYALIDIDVKGTFPLLESFFIGALLAGTISGLSAVVKINGKNVLSYIEAQLSYLQYAIYSIAISVMGITLFSAVFFFFSERFYENSPNLSEVSPNQLLAGPMGIWTWNLSHFIPLNFKIFDSEEREAFGLQLFSSFGELSMLDVLYSGEAIKELFLLENGVPLLLKASFLVPAALLALAGYRLYRTHKLTVIELVKFSAIYGAVMALTRFFSSIKVAVSVSGEEVYGLKELLLEIQPNIMPVFIISTLFALVFIAAGGYLNKYLSGTVN